MFRDLKTDGATCEVCGIGSVFASMVNIGNQSTCSEFGLNKIWVGYGLSDDKMRNKLDGVFSEEHRVLIETAFEKNAGLGMDNEGATEEPENLGKAVSFGKKYRLPHNRLKAIMNNIIKNKGEFIP